jgi:hypothetical protein
MPSQKRLRQNVGNNFFGGKLMYKYFTWKDSNGYQRGQNLLSYEQVGTMLEDTRGKHDVFATIQDYSSDGVAIGCPVYFDIDSPSLLEAYSETSSLFFDLWADFDVKPMMFFSGSKGFHIIMPLYVRHPRCHEIVEMIANEYKRECLDFSVYRRRSMWRCDKTLNIKSGMYKTRTNEEESFSAMIDRAKRNQHLDNWTNVKRKDLPIDAYIARLPEQVTTVGELKGTETMDMPPCMLKLWSMKSPPAGQAHHLANVITRWCYKAGHEPDDVVRLFESHKFWAGVNPNDYKKVIRSIYTTGNAGVGCKRGNDAKLLQPYCNNLCPFNEVSFKEMMQ